MLNWRCMHSAATPFLVVESNRIQQQLGGSHRKAGITCEAWSAAGRAARADAAGSSLKRQSVAQYDDTAGYG